MWLVLKYNYIVKDHGDINGYKSMSFTLVLIIQGSHNMSDLCAVTAVSPEEYRVWMEGLQALVHDTQLSPYPLQVER